MFSDQLRGLRKEQGWTQAEAARQIGIAWRTLQDVEAGSKKPSYDTLLKIADCFDVSVDYLMGRTDRREVNR